MSYIENHLNLDTDDVLETFGDYVYDNLRRIYKLYYSKKECPLTAKKRREEYKRIYASEPWTVFGSDRYYKMTGGKNKLMSFFIEESCFSQCLELKRKF